MTPSNMLCFSPCSPMNNNIEPMPTHTIHPYLILSHLHYGFWKKIVTLSRVIGIITREFYTMKIGFKLLGDNIKVFY